MAGMGFRVRDAALIALGTATLGMADPAQADVKAGVDAWSAGIQATRSGDKAGAQRLFAEAIREWQTAANAGDADAEFNLAQAYKLGLGVPQDLGKAEVLYGKAAAQGHLQAADIYGLLLYQRGEHAKAMPFVEGAADRGDPRAQYVQGLALFNGDGAAKDWVRAYALVSLAQQAGLPQARDALAQMDKYISLDQRQQAAALAPDLAAKAEANRNRQVAAADLGVKPQPVPTKPVPTAPVRMAAATPPSMPQSSVPQSSMPPAMPVPKGVSAARLAQSGLPTAAGRAAGLGGPAGAGADFARAATSALPPASSPRTVTPAPRATTAAPAPSNRFATAFAQPPAPRPAPAPTAPARVAASTPAPASGGAWRIQLGAFGVASNADAMWAKVKGRAEVAGHARLNAPSGKVTRLLATGYSESEAQAACRKLSAAGVSCLATKN